MILKKNISFLSVNLIFTFSYLIIAFQYIQINELALKAILIILFTLNAFILIFPIKLRIVVLFLLLAITSIYFGTQTIFYRSFNQYGMITTALSVQSNMFKFAGSAFEFFKLFDVIYFVMPFIAVYFVFTLNKRKWIDSKPINQILTLILFLSFASIQYNAFHQELKASSSKPMQIQDKEVIYANIPNTNVFVAQFGLNGLLMREFDKTITRIEFQPEFSINQQITDLLSSQIEIVKNPYSGIFEGKSLLLIQAESLNNLAIDPILTPTLYRLKHNGLFVEGYNSPLLAGSTSDTEFMVNTSLLPATNGKITFNEYAENIYPLTLANTFKENAYFSMASHNNYGEYYNRSVMLPNLGYTFYDAIGLNAQDNIEDSYVINYIKWIMYDYEKHFSFWITFNGHQPYSIDTLTEKMKDYYAIVNNKYPEMPEAEKVYFAKNMDLDRGLALLLKDYANNNRLENLVIMVYGDHFPKGLFANKEDYKIKCDANGLIFETCFDTPLIIWNNDRIIGNINKVSSPLDIAPTIYDLFNLNYEKNYALGNSVFNPNYTGFNFNEFGVIKTDNYTYDTLRDTVIHNWTKTEEEFRIEAEALYVKLQVGYQIVENDYFNSNEFKEKFVRE